MRTCRGVFYLMVCLLLTGTSSTYAQVKAKPGAQAVKTEFVTVFTPNSPKESPEKQILGFRIDQITGGKNTICPKLTPVAPGQTPPKYELSDLKRLLECAAGNSNLLEGPHSVSPNNVEASIELQALAAKEALNVAVTARDDSSMRAFAHKDNGILLVSFVNATMKRVGATNVFVEGPKSEFSFKESARESRFASDLQSLASVAIGIGARGLINEIPDGRIDPTPVVWMESSLRVQTETRSDIEVTHKLGDVATLGSDFDDDQLARWRLRLVEADADAASSPETCKDILSGISAGGKTLGDVAELSRRQNPTAIATCQLTTNTSDVVKVSAAEALSRRQSDVVTILLRRELKKAEPRKDADVLKGALIKALTGGDAGGPRNVPSSGGAGGDEGAKARTTKVISGGHEHWFLSADVALTDDLNVGQSKTGELELQDKPPSFYVGIDYLLGDLLTSDRAVWQNIVFKAFVKGTTRPQESVGIGIGLRGKYLGWAALNFEAFSPYFALTFTQTEPGQKFSDRKAVGRFGVSLNLDKAIDWIK